MQGRRLAGGRRCGWEKWKVTEDHRRDEECEESKPLATRGQTSSREVFWWQKEEISSFVLTAPGLDSHPFLNCDSLVLPSEVESKC